MVWLALARAARRTMLIRRPRRAASWRRAGKPFDASPARADCHARPLAAGQAGLCPCRDADAQRRSASRAKGEQLAALVPPGRRCTCSGSRTKVSCSTTAGIVLAAAGTSRNCPRSLNRCTVSWTQSEWHWQWSATGRAALLHLTDEQGDPIVLVRAWQLAAQPERGLAEPPAPKDETMLLASGFPRGVKVAQRRRADPGGQGAARGRLFARSGWRARCPTWRGPPPATYT